MLNNILKIEGVTTLSKEQQRTISGSGPCAVYIDGEVWRNMDVLEAQNSYQINSAAGRDARYCCASCGERAWFTESFQ